MTSSQPTLAALLTPPGTAALAVIAVRGPCAWPVLSSRFKPLAAAQWPPEVPGAGDFWLGQFRASERGLVDHVIVATDRADEQTWLEVHCHGGRQIVRWICEILETEGIAIVPWQTLKKQTEGGASDIEAALAQAPTMRTAATLLDQAQGATEREIAGILGDWPGPDAGTRLAALASRIEVGMHLARPWKVAVLGAPNVGKSSLINALAGYTRSIVSEAPGTTRDLLSVRLAIDGWPIELWDTAGMRQSLSTLEHEGIQKSRKAGADADLCLWVLDSSAPPFWPDFTHARLRFVLNKIDLPPGWPLQVCNVEARIESETLRQTTAPMPCQDVPTLRVPVVSAKTGLGIAELCQLISGWLVPEPPPAGAAVPCTSGIAGRIGSAHRLFGQRHFDAARLELLSILNVDQGLSGQTSRGGS